jgi:hypothetical protein
MNGLVFLFYILLSLPTGDPVHLFTPFICTYWIMCRVNLQFFLNWNCGGVPHIICINKKLIYNFYMSGNDISFFGSQNTENWFQKPKFYKKRCAKDYSTCWCVANPNVFSWTRHKSEGAPCQVFFSLLTTLQFCDGIIAPPAALLNHVVQMCRIDIWLHKKLGSSPVLVLALCFSVLYLFIGLLLRLQQKYDSALGLVGEGKNFPLTLTTN